jgi:hypothetical protein
MKKQRPNINASIILQIETYCYNTYLYKITSSGIKKITDLSQGQLDYGGYKIIGNKVVYVRANSKVTKTNLYECKLDGSGKKRLASYNGWYHNIYYLTSDYCILTGSKSASDESYKKGIYTIFIATNYNFKTKKKTVFPENIAYINVIGKSVYYTVSYWDSIYGSTKEILYKRNLDGSNKKKIATFKTSKKNKGIWIDEITSKYCIYHTKQKVQNGDKTKYIYTSYKYDYSTKKIKKIKSYTAAY